ncbi:uncharacterized protein LACBIDRAFT_327720 [Laccaria bicolor S238N-H82]|uniref:Predicted protein n=1 Tax=Laccaria bicolor (strain S238N-H82 / ATCC MYA-4686) TaxID=486041 RepID=B0DCN4_LACBS|nr:uncharacterized protein LACBIDRAFT_327720 [Laccaria bicolor S238N-H82]EDR07927.1 predicted protein [Laccaria bicolor S238N-H82]|eukprot:XP_001881716.1 predicted protein [Laccaria bicolor S238N-H82]
MITPPLTVPIAGFEERLGCSIFSIPPSPKIWSVHGSMYDREGGCMSARKASKDSILQTWISSWRRTCLEARADLQTSGAKLFDAYLILSSMHNHPALKSLIYLLVSQVKLFRFTWLMSPVDSHFRSAAEAQVTSGPRYIDCLQPSTLIKSSGRFCTAAHFDLNKASFEVYATNTQPPTPQKFGIDFQWMRASTFPWLIHSHPHYTRETTSQFALTKIKPMAADQETKSHELVAESKDTGLQRDSTFYQDTVVFRVEGTLFKVPRRGFESGSGVFATMFTLPSVLEKEKEGQSDETPIILEGIKKDDFRSLLHLMYPIGPGDPDVPRNGLISALHLATMWDLNDVRQLQFLFGVASKSSYNFEDPSLRNRTFRFNATEFIGKGHPRKTRNGAELVAEWEIDALDWETIAKLFFVQKQISPPQCERGVNHYQYCNCCGDTVRTTCCIKEKTPMDITASPIVK